MRNFLKSDGKSLEALIYLEAIETACAGLSDRIPLSERTVSRYNAFMRSLSNEVIREVRKRKREADIQN